MKIAEAYATGVEEALGSFGIRLASDLIGRRMPDGPEHLGAEWLTKALARERDEYRRPVGNKPSHRPRERAPQWGPNTSMEASSTATGDTSSMSPYGGV